MVLSPTIELTQAGMKLISAKRKEEIFLKQLLKFQVPSPYHIPTDRAANFWVKPYLELFRLVRHFGSLRFDELRLFGLQLTDYRNFDTIVDKIERFRIGKAKNKGKYKQFYKAYLFAELREIFADRIEAGETKTRETRDASITKFLQTQSQNLRDYADACIRYLRATGLVNVSHIGKSLSIIPEKTEEVDFFLEHVEREPVFIDELDNYVNYLGNADLPKLLTDDRNLILNNIQTQFPKIKCDNLSLEELKELLADELDKRKEEIIINQITEIKDYKLFEDINTTFEQILDKSLYDAPLMLEWNTWRAMTMMDGGIIKANLKFDDFGNPMSTAQGNIADIICDYGDFGVTVEVTLQSGQRQYEAEGEPVTRHLAKMKKETEKPAYCLFIAPKINQACIAHFYALHKMNISYYGGKSTIIPLPLNVFIKMMEDSYNVNYVPEPKHIQRIFEKSNEIANSTDNEVDWYNGITEYALNWLE